MDGEQTNVGFRFTQFQNLLRKSWRMDKKLARKHAFLALEAENVLQNVRFLRYVWCKLNVTLDGCNLAYR